MLLVYGVEWAEDPNWEDAAQILLGVSLMIPGLNGGVVIAGSTILFGWELYEYIRDN